MKCSVHRPGHFARECPEGDEKGRSVLKYYFCVWVSSSSLKFQVHDYYFCVWVNSYSFAQVVVLAETLVAVVALEWEGTEMEVKIVISYSVGLFPCDVQAAGMGVMVDPSVTGATGLIS